MLLNGFSLWFQFEQFGAFLQKNFKEEELLRNIKTGAFELISSSTCNKSHF